MAGSFCRYSICHLVFPGNRRSSQCCRRSNQSSTNDVVGFWFGYSYTGYSLHTHFYSVQLVWPDGKRLFIKVRLETSDSPLPLALGHIVDNNNILVSFTDNIGLFGLVASFHGIILAAGRSSFEFGRVKFAPAFLGKVHPRFQTPRNALLVNMVIGIIALA